MKIFQQKNRLIKILKVIRLYIEFYSKEFLKYKKVNFIYANVPCTISA